MKSFKITTTGKDMLSDIVLAGYDAGVAEECPECEGSANHPERPHEGQRRIDTHEHQGRGQRTYPGSLG